MSDLELYGHGTMMFSLINLHFAQCEETFLLGDVFSDWQPYVLDDAAGK